MQRSTLDNSSVHWGVMRDLPLTRSPIFSFISSCNTWPILIRKTDKMHGADTVLVLYKELLFPARVLDRPLELPITSALYTLPAKSYSLGSQGGLTESLLLHSSIKVHLRTV